MSKMVYIASKYNEPSSGARLQNTHINFDFAIELYTRSKHELVPYSPLWTHFLDERMQYLKMGERENEFWYEFDNAIIPKMDAMLKVTKWGESKGADAEEVLAEHLKIPVFYTMEQILKWNESQKSD